MVVCALACTSSISGASKSQVDILLVLAADVSGSVNDARWKVQRDGYAAAFQDPRILEILKGRRVAVTFMQWSASFQQHQSVDWNVLDSEESTLAFAESLSKVERRFNNGTAIGAALYAAHKLLIEAPMVAARRIIDISGDGRDNLAPVPLRPELSLETARAQAVAAGIVINGLPIHVREITQRTIDNPGIDEYYARYVIGGNGSFIVLVNDGNDFASFREALVQKLLRELITSAD
jgi:hypothetical protein